MTPEHLYRFRSIRALLDGFHELENQEIYFSPPAQLNDPLEGLMDVFWRGDAIVWTNLLRHYLLCLMQSTCISLTGELLTTDLCAKLARQTIHDLPEAPICDIYAAICNDFLQQDAPKAFVEYASSNSKSIRREELIFLLRLQHTLAVHSVMTHLNNHDMSFFTPTEKLNTLMRTSAETMGKVLRDHGRVPVEFSDLMYTLSGEAALQLNLIHEYNNDIPDDRKPWLTVVRDFPDLYVDALERLIYPDWYAACFVANPTNASMWGTYGDGHRGVCLKYRTSASPDGQLKLDLRRATGLGGSIGGERITHFGFVSHVFEKVQYTADYPEIDFFQSLGNIPRYKLAFWYSGLDGKLSDVSSDVLGEGSAWRDAYWNRSRERYSVKTVEWEHEEEYRLVLSSGGMNFEDLTSRKLKYNFSDLTGIVFGMRTSFEDKIKVIGVIDQKCKTESRRDFEFHQARYSHRKRKIELLPLSMLRPRH